VLAANKEAVCSGLVLGSVECAMDGMVVCALDDGTVICALDDGTVIFALDDGIVVCALDHALVLFFFLLLEVDFVDMFGTVEVSAVAGDTV